MRRATGWVNYDLARPRLASYEAAVAKVSDNAYGLANQRARSAAGLVVRGVVLNLGLAIVKIGGGVIGNTYALIADGVESLVDVGSSLMALVGLRVAARPPDDEHPFGHGKAESLAALGVALFVFAAAGWIAWHAVLEILEPHRGPHGGTLILLAVVIFVKIWFSRKMARASEAAGSTALEVEALHHWADALTSAAAFVGISIALIGGEGYAAADDWAALVACAIIVFNGIAMLNRAVGDVMDTAVPASLEDEVRGLAVTVPGVLAIDKCRIRKSGLNHLVDIHVRVNGDLSVREGHEIAHLVKDALMVSAPHAITDVSVHVEPVD